MATVTPVSSSWLVFRGLKASASSRAREMGRAAE